MASEGLRCIVDVFASIVEIIREADVSQAIVNAEVARFLAKIYKILPKKFLTVTGPNI